MASLSISRAWDESSAFLTRESRLVVPVALALLMIPTAVQGWINPAEPGQASRMPLVGLVAMVVTLAGQLALTRLAVGWPGSIGGVIGQSFRRVPLFLATLVLAYLPVVLLLVVTVDFKALVDVPPDHLLKQPGVERSLLVCTIVGIALLARFNPISALTMSQPASPVALVKRSWALTKGHFWQLLGMIFLLGIATLILKGSVTLVARALVLIILGPIEPLSLGALLKALADGLAAAAIGSVNAAMLGRAYAQLSVQPHVPDVSGK